MPAELEPHREPPHTVTRGGERERTLGARERSLARDPFQASVLSQKFAGKVGRSAAVLARRADDASSLQDSEG
jgi:hypothetical protein